MELRKAPRYNLRLPFRIVRQGHQSVSVAGETRNLSAKGVLFKSETPLRVGDLVEYVITLPSAPGPEGPARLHCLGKVVRFGRNAEIAATLERYEFVR
ncbi:MAG: PilZ domain-containing protein [Acidobacteriia bacterium]|nr:PilZ domain-containing protein [Terriglobia bacterium]